MIRRLLSIPLALILLLWTWAGCASGRSEILSAYDNLPFKDTFTYSAEPADVIRALSDAMYSRGGIVTMIDNETGIVTAELETGDLLPEEEHAAAVDDEGSGDSLVTIIFAGIVATFLFLILFGWLGDGCGSDHDEEEESTEGPGRRHRPERIPDREWNDGGEIIIIDPDAEVVHGYRYAFTFTVQGGPYGRTSLRMRTLRQESENGVIVRTFALQNAYLNYALDEKIRAEVSRP